MRRPRALHALLLTTAVAAANASVAAADAAAIPGATGYSASALYNSANLHARQGATGLAVLDYERALLLEPNDLDARSNLARVRSAAGLPPVRESWFDSHGRFAPPNTLYWACIAGLMLVGSGALLLRFVPRRRRLGWSGVVLGLPVCGAAAWNAAATWPVLHEAVVLRTTAARVSPAATGDTLFTLPEGQLVRDTDEFRGYVLVKPDSGPAGWVSAADIAAVIPAGQQNRP